MSPLRQFNAVTGAAKKAVVNAVTGLFSHGPVPLEHTLDYSGDPGLLGPDSVSWRVIGDASAFVGGIRALLVQTAHPEVVAGVENHSSYRDDPLGRLSRTSVYVTETTYGAMPEVEAAVATVRKAHIPVKGESERGRPYSASRPEMAAWVHNVLTDSFLAAYQAYGPTPLSDSEADQFVREQTKIGELLGANPMPNDMASLRHWVVDHPDAGRSQALEKSIEFLRHPPLSWPIFLGYRILFDAAVATLQPETAVLLGLDQGSQSLRIGRKSVASLRWALGSSPAWHMSLVRAGAPIPSDVTFRTAMNHPAAATETDSQPR